MIIVRSYPLGEINTSFAVGEESESNKLVRNLWINTADAVSDSYIEVSYNGVVKRFNIVDECRYTPMTVLFYNKEGAKQTYTFFKARRETIDISRENYMTFQGEFKHQFVDYNVNGKEKVTVNSGFVDEDANPAVKELLLTTRCWELLPNGVAVPLRVSQSSLEFKTRQNDRLINYTIEFEYAFNTIQ